MSDELHSSTPGAPTPAAGPPSTRTARWIAVVAFLVYAVSGGGRIVGSDEVTMLELARSMLHGRIDVPEGATLRGPDGRFYTKNAAGQAVIALPLVAVAEGAARASGLPLPRRELAVRFVVSFFNAAVAGLLLAVFYAAARGLGARAGPALAATLLLGFATPLWVYAKSFMAEPLQGLGLLLALWGSVRAMDDPRHRWTAAGGFLIAASVKPSMAPVGLMCLMPLLVSWRPREWAFVLGVVLVPVALLLLYNFARFGSPLETGYGAQATPAGYTTPLLVGLYGLLFSSGKGVLWFAPALWLALGGGRAMQEVGGAGRAAAAATLAAWGVALGLYSTFEHWAGDGSFGPRYLVPLLPLAFLAVAFALDRASRARRALAWGLGVAGLIVQLGGVSIHFGAQMREAGDYPYTLPLNDPHFMSESHFDPHFSPMAGHWRMLLRNAGEHLRGRAPRLSGTGEPDPRLGVSADDQARLLHALDFWWLYMIYAGLPGWPVMLGPGVLLAVTAWAALTLHAAFRDEAWAA